MIWTALLLSCWHCVLSRTSLQSALSPTSTFCIIQHSVWFWKVSFRDILCLFQESDLTVLLSNSFISSERSVHSDVTIDASVWCFTRNDLSCLPTDRRYCSFRFSTSDVSIKAVVTASKLLAFWSPCIHQLQLMQYISSEMELDWQLNFYSNIFSPTPHLQNLLRNTVESVHFEFLIMPVCLLTTSKQWQKVLKSPARCLVKKCLMHLMQSTGIDIYETNIVVMQELLLHSVYSRLLTFGPSIDNSTIGPHWSPCNVSISLLLRSSALAWSRNCDTG